MALLIALVVLTLSLTACGAEAVAQGVPIIVENPQGAPAGRVPLSAGVPFARKALLDPSILTLADNAGASVPLQTQVLSRWPDGSCRWVLLDFQADMGPDSKPQLMLRAQGPNPAPAEAASAVMDDSGVVLSNGRVTFKITKGASRGVLSAGGASVEILSEVEIGRGDKRITSTTVADALEVYAEGPLRAAVAVYGRRIYSDGLEGPFSQRIEMYAGSSFVKVEDTFVYAHLPGTHAAPQNPLSLWRLRAAGVKGEAKLAVMPFIDDEEADGLAVASDSVAFWGADKPFDLSRHTDEELFGEDTPGIALGLGKSCAALFSLETEPSASDVRPVRSAFAHTTPAVYAASGALPGFAAKEPGRFEAAEEGMRQILGFWMWFQDNDPKGLWGRGPWHGIFDWGDWQTRYSDVNGKPTGWQYLEGRYGWDCNEMDTTLMLWNAFLHTGESGYWRAAVAMSRHMMDVDMINVDYRKYDLPEYVYDPHSYGAPWKEGRDRLFDINTIGMGRRHNVQHWGNGVGDTRHTWNGGVIMYYYTTGNRRAYDAAIAMADMHMQRIWGYACGEYTLSMWCLYNAWQLTGEKKYIEEFKYRLGVIRELQFPDGSIPEHLDFDKKTAYPEVDERGGGGGLAFDYISNALADYHADTADPVARQVLLGLCDLLARAPIRYGDTYQDINYFRGFAWAWRETKDERYLERLKYWLSSMEAAPLAKGPGTEKEWVDSTYELLRQQAWRIRHIGPGVRMMPYALYVMPREEDKRE